jgi:hypothetical protein
MRLRRLLKIWNKNEIKMTKERRLEFMNLKAQDPTNHEVKMYLKIGGLNRV